MSENLVYGANICAYGAVGDGKTDSTNAFLKAIEKGESLISVPFGTYKITGQINLNSNTKIHLHPRAVIEFEPKNKNDVLFGAKGKANIIICGGIFNAKSKKALFCFEKTDNIKIFNTQLCGGILFENCEDVKIKALEFEGGKDTAIRLSGECEDIKVRNCTVNIQKPFIELCDGADVEELTISDVDCKMCSHFIKADNAKAEEIECADITCAFCDSFVEASKDSLIEDADFENLNLSYLDYTPDNKDGAYFKLLGKIEGLEIESFKRDAEKEAFPSVPSIILCPKSDTAMILDGTGLDNVINARGASKTVGMTTARLTNPTNKFVYTLECKINGGDKFTMPVGDFDFVSIYEK